MAKKKMLKDQLKATKNELAKRLTALEAWQQKGVNDVVLTRNDAAQDNAGQQPEQYILAPERYDQRRQCR